MVKCTEAKDDEDVCGEEEYGFLELEAAVEGCAELCARANGPGSATESALVDGPEVEGGEKDGEDSGCPGKSDHEDAAEGPGQQGKRTCPHENETHVGAAAAIGSEPKADQGEIHDDDLDKFLEDGREPRSGSRRAEVLGMEQRFIGEVVDHGGGVRLDDKEEEFLGGNGPQGWADNGIWRVGPDMVADEVAVPGDRGDDGNEDENGGLIPVAAGEKRIVDESEQGGQRNRELEVPVAVMK